LEEPLNLPLSCLSKPHKSVILLLRSNPSREAPASHCCSVPPRSSYHPPTDYQPTINQDTMSRIYGRYIPSLLIVTSRCALWCRNWFSRFVLEHSVLECWTNDELMHLAFVWFVCLSMRIYMWCSCLLCQ
jgi:hypothetical protein